jgi:hypothetical protein
MRYFSAIVFLCCVAQSGWAVELLPPKAVMVGDKMDPTVRRGVSDWAAVDVDLDGRLEIVGAVSSGSSESLVVFRRGTSGILAPAETLVSDVGHITGLRVADVDGDGRTDLIIQVLTNPTLRVMRHLGPSQWTTHAVETGQPCCARGVFLHDWDGDGTTDLVRRYVDDSTGAARLDAARWDPGMQGFVSAGALPVPGGDLAVVTDLDGDGGRDLIGSGLVTGIPGASGGLWIAREDAGTWPTPLVLGPAPFGTGRVVLGDLDGDGDRDILFAAGLLTTAARAVQWFARDAAGAYAFVDAPASYENPGAVAIADLDSDGRDDVVVASDGWSAITVLPGTPTGPGPGSFVMSAVCELSTCAVSYFGDMLGTVDVDGDGWLDVVLGDAGEGLTVFYNAAGTTPRVDLTTSVSTVPRTSRVGAVTRFDLRVSNAGPQASSAGELVALLPRRFTLVDVPNGCTGEAADGYHELVRIRCPLGAIGAGNSRTFAVRGRYGASDGLSSANDARVAWFVDAHEVDTDNGDDLGHSDLAVEDIPGSGPPDDGGAGDGDGDGGGGGGGPLGPGMLVGLGAALLLRRRRA